MIKIILLLIIILPISIKADLTKNQEEDIAILVTKFIENGNKRINSDGYPLLAYMEGQARIDGYQRKPHKVIYDFINKNYINANKWTFDDSSFVSFIYYQAFDLILTQSITNDKDLYSDLFLRKLTGNPYFVSTYLEDAENNEHFYYVKHNIEFSKLDYNILKKGDILIVSDNHILIYVGEQKFAHATKDAITNSNLGFEITTINDNINKNVSIIRIKNNIISNNRNVNTLITWIDNNEKVDLKTGKVIDQELPQIIYTKPLNTWAKNITLNFEIIHKNDLDSYSFSNGEDKWVDLEGKTATIAKTINENDTYFLKVKDKKGLIATETIEINSIDDIPPYIEKATYASKKTYSLITIDAVDNESGLDFEAYSYDNQETWTNKNYYEATEEKIYNIYVRDKIGNISSTKLDVKINIKNNPKINNVILGDYIDGKRKVSISFFNCNACKLLIARDNSERKEWIDINADTYITYLTNGTYQILLKDNEGKEVDLKTIEIKENNTKLLPFLLLFVPLITIGVGAYFLTSYKNNKI